MCPKPNETGSSLNKKSHVEDFPEKEQFKELFKSLTEQPDSQDRWIAYTYAVDLDPTLFNPKKELKLHFRKYIIYL